MADDDKSPTKAPAAKKTPAPKQTQKRAAAKKASTRTAAKKAAPAKKAASKAPKVEAPRTPVEQSGLTSVSHDALNPAFAVKTDA